MAKITDMADSDMATVLARLCAAYTQSDRRTIYELEPVATNIGHALNLRGGLQAMRHVHGLLENRRGARTLEMHWNGIGDWLG
jgi:hypothetical protein